MCDIHGCNSGTELPPIEIDQDQRRLFLKGLATLPLAAVLATPELARAAAESLQDVSVTLDDGTPVTASLAMPKDATNAPTIALIHEWWGLNDQIKSVAAELANQGYIALAVDLYGGKVGTNRDEALALMKGLDGGIATQTMVKWVDYLRNHENGNGKVATMGWCFGGGWSLNTSTATPVDATVIYYGRVNQPADTLASLSGPVLGHFGTMDKSINAEMVAGFEAEMTEAGKADNLTVHWYEADHAFANPTGSRYDQEDAATSWERTMAFLKENMS